MDIGRCPHALHPPVLLLSLGILLRSLCSSCPPPCVCPAHDNATLCKHRLLSSIPVEIPLTSHFLDLSHNRIRSVPHGAFSHLQYLQELDLSHNQLSRIEPGAFSGLSNIRILLIHHNQLKLLPPGVFTGMPDLTWMDIRANQLVILLDQTFRGLKELRHLEISDNPLLFISPGALLGMPLLQRLGLEKTKLSMVPTHALTTLTRLSELRLGGVTSTMLHDLSFTGMPLLRVLYMDNWPSLKNLGPLSLSGLNLSSISLTQCNLTSVPTEALISQVHLRRLDLSQNPIATLEHGCFHSLRSLEELRLSGGRLNSIPSGSFHGLDQLRVLDLSHNPLEWVEEDAIPPPGILETLLLSSTNLSCDCRLCWLLHQKINFGGTPPVCSAPAILRGTIIPEHSQMLCPELFTCQPPRLVEKGPREMKVKEGERLTISCQSYGVPEPSIHWVLPTEGIKSIELDDVDKGSTQLSRYLSPAEVSSSGRPHRNLPLMKKAADRISVLPGGSLQILPVQPQDSGAYLCLATNLAGNDSTWIHLEVAPFNGSTHLPPLAIVHTHLLVVITAGGILPFISSVAFCFIFIFLWSRSRGNIKHTANIDYVPRTSRVTTSQEDNKFTMKLI